MFVSRWKNYFTLQLSTVDLRDVTIYLMFVIIIFSRRNVLEQQRSNGLDDMGPIKPSLALCVFGVFVVVYFSLWKGVRSAGKVSNRHPFYLTTLTRFSMLDLNLVVYFLGIFLAQCLYPGGVGNCSCSIRRAAYSARARSDAARRYRRHPILSNSRVAQT